MNVYAKACNYRVKDAPMVDASDLRANIEVSADLQVSFFAYFNGDFTGCSASVIGMSNGEFMVCFSDRTNDVSTSEYFCDGKVAMRVAHGWCIAD